MYKFILFFALIFLTACGGEDYETYMVEDKIEVTIYPISNKLEGILSYTSNFNHTITVETPGFLGLTGIFAGTEDVQIYTTGMFYIDLDNFNTRNILWDEYSNVTLLVPTPQIKSFYILNDENGEHGEQVFHYLKNLFRDRYLEVAKSHITNQLKELLDDYTARIIFL